MQHRKYILCIMTYGNNTVWNVDWWGTLEERIMEESLMIKDTKEFSDSSFLHLYRSSVALGADSDVSIFINERKWIIYI